MEEVKQNEQVAVAKSELASQSEVNPQSLDEILAGLKVSGFKSWKKF
jgi:hypothetical protein